jgi:hypothetical protein
MMKLQNHTDTIMVLYCTIERQVDFDHAIESSARDSLNMCEFPETCGRRLHWL